MWPIWSMPLEKASCDLGFIEAINKRMQVPSRLKVAEDPSAGNLQVMTPKDCPPSYQVHIPDRILLSEMTTNAAFQPVFLNQLSHQILPLEEPLLEPAVQPAIYGEQPFLTFISGPGSPKHKRLAHQSKAGKERALAKNRHLALGTLDQRQDCSLEKSVTSESSPEDFGTTEVLAMRKQLMKISVRLQHLEKQRVGWHQKELLFYSVLASSCLLNMWLWHKR